MSDSKCCERWRSVVKECCAEVLWGKCCGGSVVKECCGDVSW